MLLRDSFPKIEDLGRTQEEVCAEIDSIKKKLDTEKIHFIEKSKLRKQLNKDYQLLQNMSKR